MLETAISVQNWAKHLGPHPGILHSSSYVGKILPLSLQKASGENRMQRIGTHHRSGEIVDDEVLGHPAENAHAASSPAMTSASFCSCMGQTKRSPRGTFCRRRLQMVDLRND